MLSDKSNIFVYKSKKGDEYFVLAKKHSENEAYFIDPAGELKKLSYSYFSTEIQEGHLQSHDILTKEQIVSTLRYFETGSVKPISVQKNSVRIPSLNRMNSSEKRYQEGFNKSLKQKKGKKAVIQEKEHKLRKLKAKKEVDAKIKSENEKRRKELEKKRRLFSKEFVLRKKPS